MSSATAFASAGSTASPQSAPPPPYVGFPWPAQVYPHYQVPCKCDLANQIRYYNHQTRRFYYHTAVQHAGVAAGATLASDAENDTAVHDAAFSPDTFSNPQLRFDEYYYDPYGPVGLYPGDTPGPPGPHFVYYKESGLAEGIVVVLALLLWLYSFYRLYLVWQNTLNFSESSIQGPQGWDLLVNWIMERIRIKNLRMIGRSTKRKTGRRKSQGLDLLQQESGAEFGGAAAQDDVCVSMEMEGEEVAVTLETGPFRTLSEQCSIDMSHLMDQQELKDFLASVRPDPESAADDSVASDRVSQGHTTFTVEA